jgi:glycosyltransferase involved in cell wall biosynthesis
MSMVKITVVIPCYNHGAYLWEAIRSVENAGFSDYEIIIVDDGSTDPETRKVALEVQEAGYHILLQENQGVAASRNNAIRLARGEFIIPLDADNRLLKPYFFKGLEILEQNPDVGVVYGDALIIGEKSGDWKNHPLVLEEMLFENYIDTCTIIRRSMWEQIGGYDSKAPVPTRQDYIFWLDCLKHDWKFVYLPEYCFEYRFLDGSEVRKYARISSKRLLITEYIFEKQKVIIKQSAERGHLNSYTSRLLMAGLLFQLASYHLISGSIIRGYFYLYEAILWNPQKILKSLKLGLGWPLKRFILS